MQMSRYLVTRIVAVSVVILLAGLSLALWRAQYDVQREERGALEIVQLFEHLYAIENGPAGEVETRMQALQRINAAGNLRHIQLDLRDAAGTVRVAPRNRNPSGVLERLFALTAPGMRSVQADPSGPWTLQRDDNARFTAILSLDPSSEQREALDNLLGMLLVLLGYGAVLLLAVYWALRRTLAPLQPIQRAIERYAAETDDAVTAHLGGAGGRQGDGNAVVMHIHPEEEHRAGRGRTGFGKPRWTGGFRRGFRLDDGGVFE